MSVNPVAQQIAESLGETEARPVWQIEQIVSVMGETSSLGVLAQTERVEANGGMLVPDGSRRRTPGGVFFALARKELPAPERRRIFGPAVAPEPGDAPTSESESDGLPRLVLLPRRQPEPATPARTEVPPSSPPVPAPKIDAPAPVAVVAAETNHARPAQPRTPVAAVEPPSSIDPEEVVARLERDLDARLGPAIARAVQTLARDLETMFRRGAIEEAERRLGFASAATPSRPKRVSSVQRGSVRPAPAKTQATVAPDDVLTLVRTRPGLRVDEIASALGRPIAEVQSAAAGLLAAGKLTKAGRTRGTRYSVPNGDASASHGSSAAAPEA